jgi:hypothetical protein
MRRRSEGGTANHASDTPLTRYLKASRWLEIPMLLDPSEWDELLAHVGPLHICEVGRVGGLVTLEQLSEAYRTTIDSLRQGNLQVDRRLSCALTVDLGCVQSVTFPDGRQMFRPMRPVIQMQPFYFTYDEATKAFHPRVFGPHTTFWGVHFSMAQLFEKPETRELLKSSEDPLCQPNLERMRRLQRWSRDQTVPFKKLPIRLGHRMSHPWFK